MGTPEPDPEETIRSITLELVDTFDGVDRDRIATMAREEYSHLAATSKAPAFLGILSERRVRDRLARESRRRSA